MIMPEGSELPGGPGPLVVWVDGALVPEHEARISPFDHGLLTGDGVFETLRVYRGEPYCWRRHYERLARSAQGMGLAIPPGPALRRAALEVIGANRFTDGRLRITVTGGPSPLGSERGRVTPTLILELAGRLHIAAEEVTLPLSAVATADEAFISSSTREVQGLSAVDGHPLPAAPGPVTTLLADAFRRMVADDLDP